MNVLHLLRLPLAVCAVAWLASAPPAPAQEQLRRGSSNGQLVDDELRQAVQRGHEWLQAHQGKDGSWSELVGYKVNTDYETLDSRPSTLR